MLKSLFSKVAARVFSCKFAKFFNNTFFLRTPAAASASGYYCYLSFSLSRVFWQSESFHFVIDIVASVRVCNTASANHFPVCSIKNLSLQLN